MTRLVLASRSPQRRAILDQLGVEYEVRVPDVEELESGPPHEVVTENAYRKAAAVADESADEVVVGADTVVALGSRLYGKPEDESAARVVLEALSGARHEVIGGVCVIEQGRTRTAAAATVVEFRPLDERMIDWYLRSGEWRDRAGAYAIQGRGAALVQGIEGDYLNVVGLPVATLIGVFPDLLSYLK